jgi:lipid-A-disaccharide synthase
MKYYIIAGEASGDLHASNLIKSIKEIDLDSQFRCWGGDLMAKQGATIVKHYRDLAFMGFAEVIINLRTILNNIKFCKKDIADFSPDVVILVDYPGFNLRIAEFVKSLHIPVHYYICPQIWAWKQSRIKTIKKYVDKLYVILPFEQEFYAKHGVEVNFVGHPLMDEYSQKRESLVFKDFVNKNSLENKPIIALLPGSRRQEIKKMLFLMSQMPAFFPDYQFVVAATPHIPLDFYRQNMKESNIKLLVNKTYPILENSVAAIVASGTATLETALFNVPQVVCYKGNSLSIFIGRMLIKVKFISLVNLIMDKEIVKELIQQDFNEINLKSNLSKILPGSSFRTYILDEYQKLKEKLGGEGASKRTAQKIVMYLKENED